MSPKLSPTRKGELARRWSNLFLIFTAAVAFAAVACRFLGGSSEISVTPHPAPTWELKDVDGHAVASTNYADKVVLVTFWATWCPPCKLEVPGLISLQKKYGPSGFAVVGISVDETGAAAVKPFLKEFAVNYPVALADEKVVKDFGGVEAIPKSFIIDRQGTIVAGYLGLTSEADFEKRIVSLLGTGPMR